MAEYEKKVRHILKEFGCYFVRHGKGDHDIWYSPITNKNFTVDGEIRIRHVARCMPKDLYRRQGKLRAVKTLGESDSEPTEPITFFV